MERLHDHPAWTLKGSNTPLPTAILVSLVALVCYQADKLVYILGIPPNRIASFWPPTAFLVAVLLLVRRSVWPLLLAAGLAAMALADLKNGVPIRFEIWITLGNLVETLIATFGISLLLNGVPQLSNGKALARYLPFAVIFVPFCSAIVGANGSAPGGYWLQWRLWFFADALAFLTVTPAILAWSGEGREWSRKPQNYLEFAALMTLLVFFGYLAGMGTSRGTQPALLYSLVPLLLWAALRLGLKGVSTSMVVVALLSIWGASDGRGPFAEQGPLNDALSLQVFLFFAAIPFTILAVVVEERKRAQEVLRQSEERFRMAAQAGKMFAYEWDAVTDKILRSEGVAQVLGPVEGAQTTGQQILEMISSEDRERLIAEVGKLSPEQPFLRISYRMVRSDGTVIWVERNSRAYFDHKGKMVRIIGMVADITDRKRSEEALRQKEAELSEAQRLAQVGSWDWDPINDTVSWSRELYRILGRDPSLPAASYKEHAALLAADSWERLQCLVEEALRSGTPYELDLEFVRPDGSTIWVRARGEAQRDIKGHIVRLRGTAQDITQRKLVEDALHESEERLRLAAQVGKMYAIDWDVATDLVIRSEKARQILALVGERIHFTHQEMLASVHPEDRATFISSIAALTPENPTSQVCFRLLRPNGSITWLERNGHAFFDKQGKMVRMVGMVADITERKLAEEALSRVGGRLIEAHEEERSRIARDLHDDIGQRLALLICDLNELLNELPDAAIEVRNRLHEQLKRVHEIATDTQAMSRQLHSPKLQFLGIVSAAKSFCQELSEQHKVEIDFTHDEIPLTVPDDVSLCLFRVIQESLQNAVKHSGVRHFDVELRGEPDRIHLIVRDSGLGFDPETGKNGRGLGLVSMQERVHLVSGTFSIESRPNLGTTIHVCVPLRREGRFMSATG